MFSDKDIQQIESKSITIDAVKAQVLRIKNGMSYSNLIAAATTGEGIEEYNDTETKALIKFYQAKQNELSTVKFVPASGAAARMFKFLFQFLNNFDASKESLNDYIEKANDVAFELECKRRETDDEYIDFSGDDNCEDCAGWKPGERRCNCGNRRVSWVESYSHSFKDPSIYAEAW